MEATMKDDLFDDELCGLVKFTDATTTAQKPAETEKKPVNKEPVKEKKAAQKSTSKPMDAEYEPVKESYGARVLECIKWPVVFIGLEYLIFYWQQTGQIQDSAAVPSMIACALFAGLNIGKNWRWKE